MAFLELKNVSKGYGANGARTEVLSDINLSMEKGEFVAIVGYSGAGKTTLISMIAGLIKADTGSIKLNDLEVTAPGPDRGVVFQNYSLLPWLTVYENIFLAVEQVFPNWASAKQQQHTEAHIEMVNLTPARNKKPSELSGGMRQRVGIARAFALSPKMLLLDEPFGMLDSLTRFELQEVLINLWRRDKKTALLITHDVDEALFLSDRIVMMTSGPEARVGDILEVTFPRPRNRRDVVVHPDYFRLREHLISFLEEHAHRPQAAPTTNQPPAPDGNSPGGVSNTEPLSNKPKPDTRQPQLV